MATFKWCNGSVPTGMKVTQVYGVIFTRDGRTLLKVETKKDGRLVYSLAGGTPEDFDKDMEATLRRELVEEINTTIEEPILVGYQEVDEENGKEVYAQVRMSAIIDVIGEVKPDPDNGETYQRLLVSPSRAIELLNWGSVGENLINQSLQIAKDNFNLTLTNNNEEYI